MNQKHCLLKPLAETEACGIWICTDCGTVSIHIGPVSLRMRPEHFLDVSTVMGAAVMQLPRAYSTGSAIQSDKSGKHGLN